MPCATRSKSKPFGCSYCGRWWADDEKAHICERVCQLEKRLMPDQFERTVAEIAEVRSHLFGMDIKTDPSLSEGEWELRRGTAGQ